MPKKAPEDEIVALLQQLLAIELWRAGLPQSEIRKRLGISINVVNEMLKGVSRELRVQVKNSD